MGETVLPWAIAVTIVAAAATAIDPLSRRYPKAKLDGRVAHGVLIAVAAVVTVGATWVILDVGHSGAKATWDKVGSSISATEIVPVGPDPT